VENASRLNRHVAAVLLALTLFAAAPAPVRADDASLAREIAAEARTFAGEDRHGLAVACALAALILDPSLEPEMSGLIAFQLLWQERAEEAVPWFRKRLEAHPDDLEARLGLARALSWSGELEGAAEVYSGILVDHPDNEEARLGVARMEAWRERHGAAAEDYGEVAADDPGNREARLGQAAAENARGRHREAEHLYREMLEEDPDDPAARAGLARSLHWMGEHDAGARELEGVPGAEAEDLRQAIDGEEWWKATLFGERWIDVDDQENSKFGARLEGPVGRQIRWSVEGAVGRADDPRTPALDQVRGRAGAAWRISRAWSVHANVEVLDSGSNLDGDEIVDVGEGETRSGDEAASTLFVTDNWVTWIPLDWTRLDLGAARVPVETPRALARQITINLFSLGAERRLTDLFLLRGRAAWGDYSDGNSRVSASGELAAGAWQLTRVRLDAGAGASWFAFDEAADRGYYAPESYDALYATLRAQVPLGGELVLDADARVASEHEEGDDRFGVLDGGGELRWSGPGGFGASVFGRKSTSRFSTSAGYGREGYGFSLFRVW
jgi:tetratricopeptide (TPR) repeat protein